MAARARAGLAAALAGRGDPDDAPRARALLSAAAADAAALGHTHLERRIADAAARMAPARPAPSARPETFTLAREGEVWAVASGGRTVRLKHSRALEILDVLVKNPGRELHVLDLAAAEAGDGAIDLGDAGEVLDATAQAAYRRRVAELDEELAEADAWNDAGRRERLRAELELLRDELARGVGLGGRNRRSASAVERARVNVQKRLRGVVKRIGDGLPELAAHLEKYIKTGTYVSYRPSSRP
jgi:hypothetical protein